MMKPPENEISTQYHEAKESTTRRGPSPASTFPAKLHAILSCLDLHHIITWMPHGCAWRILKPKLFAETVMPKYFTHQSKYSSFTRQVNGWGFKRITHGPDRNSYYHKLFVRDMPHLTRRMTRLSSSAMKKPLGNVNNATEPNFYETSGGSYPVPSSLHGPYHCYDRPFQHHEYNNHHWSPPPHNAPICYQNKHHPSYDASLTHDTSNTYDTAQQAPFPNVPYQHDHYYPYYPSNRPPHSDISCQRQPHHQQYQYSSNSDPGDHTPLHETQAIPPLYGQYYETSKDNEIQDTHQQTSHQDCHIESNRSMPW